MKTHFKKISASFGKGAKGSFSWLVVFTLITLLFGVVASAQETACKLSFSSDSVRTTVHPNARHTEHCIRHQNPLPEYESASSSSVAPDFSNALHVVAVVVFSDVLERPSIDFSSNDTKAHPGVSIYKYFAHFLI